MANVSFALRVMNAAQLVPQAPVSSRLSKEIRSQCLSANPWLTPHARSEFRMLAGNRRLAAHLSDQQRKLKSLLRALDTMSDGAPELKPAFTHTAFAAGAKQLMDIEGSALWPREHKLAALAGALGLDADALEAYCDSWDGCDEGLLFRVRQQFPDILEFIEGGSEAVKPADPPMRGMRLAAHIVEKMSVDTPHCQQLLTAVRRQVIAHNPWLTTRQQKLLPRLLRDASDPERFGSSREHLDELVGMIENMGSTKPERVQVTQIDHSGVIGGARILIGDVPESAAWQAQDRVDAISMWWGMARYLNLRERWRRNRFVARVCQVDEEAAVFLGMLPPLRPSKRSVSKYDADDVIREARGILESMGEKAWTLERSNRVDEVSLHLGLGKRSLYRQFHRSDALMEEIRERASEVAAWLEHSEMPKSVREFIRCTKEVIAEGVGEDDHAVVLERIGRTASRELAEPYKWARDTYRNHYELIALLAPEATDVLDMPQAATPPMSELEFIGRARIAQRWDLPAYGGKAFGFIADGCYDMPSSAIARYRVLYDRIRVMAPDVAEYLGDPSTFQYERSVEDVADALRKAIDVPEGEKVTFSQVLRKASRELGYENDASLRIRYRYPGFSEKLRRVAPEIVERLEALRKKKGARKPPSHKPSSRWNVDRLIRYARKAMLTTRPDASHHAKLRAIGLLAGDPQPKVNPRHWYLLHAEEIGERDSQVYEFLGLPESR